MQWEFTTDCEGEEDGVGREENAARHMAVGACLGDTVQQVTRTRIPSESQQKIGCDVN